MKATYFQPAPVELDVIGKPKDGLADLGRGKDILVRGVTISETKAAGTCTLLKGKEPSVGATNSVKTASEPVENSEAKPLPDDAEASTAEAAAQ